MSNRRIHEIAPEPEEIPPPSPPKRSSYTLKSLQFLQKYSAYGFSTFSLLHFSGVIFAPIVSPQLGESTIMVARTVYQSLVGEPLFVYGSAGLHVFASCSLHLHRIISTRRNYRKWEISTNAVQKSGYVLAALLTGHFITTRGGALWYMDGDSSSIGLEYIRWTMQKAFSNSTSMTLMVLMYSYHSLCGFIRWWRLRVTPKQRNRAVIGMTLLSIVSLLRIRGLPLASGWQANQFQKAYGLMQHWDNMLGWRPW